MLLPMALLLLNYSALMWLVFFFLIILLWEEVRYLPADLLDTLLLLSLYAMSLSTKPFSIFPSVKQIDFILP